MRRQPFITEVRLSIDGKTFTMEVPMALPQQQQAFTFKGADDVTRYETWIDEFYIWNRWLSTEEINYLYSNRSGYFYPFHTIYVFACRYCKSGGFRDPDPHYFYLPGLCHLAGTGAPAFRLRFHFACQKCGAIDHSRGVGVRVK